jgi:hypothetical protein
MIVGIPIKVPGTGCIVNKLSPRLGGYSLAVIDVLLYNPLQLH